MQQVLQDLPLTLAYIGADLVALAILVGALYIPRHGRRDLVAAYIGVNVGVLAVTLLLSTSDNVGAGLGLGLFGVLSIIRLRSSSLAQGARRHQEPPHHRRHPHGPHPRLAVGG